MFRKIEKVRVSSLPTLPLPLGLKTESPPIRVYPCAFSISPLDSQTYLSLVMFGGKHHDLTLFGNVLPLEW